MTKEIKEYLERESYDHATLADWYISSVGNETPVWTEEHIDELLNDFYVIPREIYLEPVNYLSVKLSDKEIAECQRFMDEMSKLSLINLGIPRKLIDELYFPKKEGDVE